MAEGIGMLAFGAACIVGAVVHWRGLAWTDHHPDSMAARTYLVWLPGGIACVVMGLVITFGTRLPDVLPDIAVRVFIVLMCSMLVLQVWEPERVRPEWQKRQKRWLADNQVDGRDPPRETWPEEWKRQGWSTDSARRLWRLDRDRSSEGSERDRR